MPAFTLTYDSLTQSVQNYTETYDAVFVQSIPQFIFNAEVRVARENKTLEAKRTAVSLFTAGQAIYPKPNRWRSTVSMNFASGTANTVVTRQNTSGTRVLTLATAHSFVVGSNIAAYNVGGAGYNGNFVVTAFTQFTITYVSGSGTEVATPDGTGFVTPPLQNATALLPRSSDYCLEYWPDLTQVGQPIYYGDDYDFQNIIIVPTPVAATPFKLSYYETPEHLSSTNQQNWLTENAPDQLLYATLLQTGPYLKNDERLMVWKQIYMDLTMAKDTEAKSRKVGSYNNRDTGT